jgi:hypothetical protein
MIEAIKNYVISFTDPETYGVVRILGVIFWAYFFYTRAFKLYSAKLFYMRQGIPFPGWHFLMFGDLGMLTALEAGKDCDPFRKYMDGLYPDIRPKITGATFQNIVWLFVHDCNLYKKIVVDHAKQVNRGPLMAPVMEKIVGGAINGLPHGEEWAAKRKVVSKAFFREKQVIITNFIKKYLGKKIKEWTAKKEIDIV